MDERFKLRKHKQQLTHKTGEVSALRALVCPPHKAFVRPAQRLRLSRNKCRAEIRPRWSRRLQRMAKYLYRLRRLSPITALGPSVIQEPALRKRFSRIPRPLTTAAGSRPWISTVSGPNIVPSVKAEPSEPIDTAAGWQGRIGAVAGDLRLTVWRRRIYDSRFHDRSRAASPLTACFVRSVERVFQPFQGVTTRTLRDPCVATSQISSGGYATVLCGATVWNEHRIVRPPYVELV